VKLLFDENLSPRLAEALTAEFPDSGHMHALGLGSADDTTVWEYARAQGYVLVTKDADFHDLSLIRGHPPKVVWIRRGNCSTTELMGLLGKHTAALRELESDPTQTVPVLY